MIHIRLKERVNTKRICKLALVYNQYSRKAAHHDNKEEGLIQLLKKRKDILLQISTRLYEEEYRKAENDVMAVRFLY